MSRRKRHRKKKTVPAAPSEPGPPTWRDRLASRAAELARKRWAPPVALALLTLVVYTGSVNAPLIFWDDDHYLFMDRRIHELSFANAWRILTGSFAANYHPVTTFTYALDRAVWGGWLPGFHLTQLAFYAGGVVMLYFVFRTVLASPPAAFAGAAIYAVHTIHVESVAWLASRKDVVCLLFYAAAILAYIRYARREWSGRRYALFAALAALAMFSKGYAVVLPAVLLAYDACFGERVGRRQFLDKLPPVALGLLLTVVMILAQEKDATPLPAPISVWDRLPMQCKIYAAYIGRTLLPAMLSVNYSNVVRTDWLGSWAAVLGALLGAGTVAGFFVLRRRLPAAAFGIALFLLHLGTVMSIFFTLRQWMTDRYLFFPSIGSALALAAAGLWVHRNLHGKKALPGAIRRLAVPAAAVAAVALYGTLTVGRIGVWKSGVDIWSDAVRKQVGLRGSGPLALHELRGQRFSNIVSLVQLAEAYKQAGDHVAAGEFMEVIQNLPERVTKGRRMGLIGLAERHIQAGRYDVAISSLMPAAMEERWTAAPAWAWIGAAHKGKGEREEARAAYERALESYHRSGRSGTSAMIELGNLEMEDRRFEEAARWFRRGREEAIPNDPRPIFNLGLALEKMGRLEEAYRLCEESLALEGRVPPTISVDFTTFTDMYVEMGIITEKLGRKEEAVRHLEEALRRSPEHPQREGILAKIRKLRARPAAPPRRSDARHGG